MDKEYCDICGELMEYDRAEWARYDTQIGEELVSIYKCTKCNEEKSVRDEKNEFPNRFNEDGSRSEL